MKMIIADLDGTLISKKFMSPSTRRTIERLQQNGFIFTVATGRHKDAVRNLVKELKIDYPVICTNGALIYDFKSEQMLHQDSVDSSIVYQVIEILNAKRADYLLYTTQSIVSSASAKARLESKIGPFESVVAEPKDWPSYIALGILKILVIEPDAERFNILRKRLEQVNDVYVLSSQPTFIDIGNKIANKGRALERLTQYLNVPLDKVLSIGDQENDITMIEKAGIGVAMADGDALLKNKANFVTKSFDQEGFSYAIQTLIKAIE